jgi:hypothetical protein
MKKTKFVIKEYCKNIFTMFGSRGTVIHEITAEYTGKKPFQIEHCFGTDEGLNEFVELGNIKEAYRRFAEVNPEESSNDYTFVLFSYDAPDKKPYVTEMASKGQEKRFKLNWIKSFGKKTKASYMWGWTNRLMFTDMDENGNHYSQIRVRYPTEKLVFRLFYPCFFPMSLEKQPELTVFDKNNTKESLGNLKEVDFYKDNIRFKINSPVSFKVFKMVVANPKVGNIYKVIWNIGLKNLSKYSDWLEARRG